MGEKLSLYKYRQDNLKVSLITIFYHLISVYILPSHSKSSPGAR